MHRLGRSAPELHRHFPITAGKDSRSDAEKQIEESWADPPNQDSKADRAFSLIWVSLLASAAIAALIYLSVRSSSPTVNTNAEQALPTLPPAERRENAEALLRGFFATHTIAEKLEFIRDPTRTEPLLEEYYSRENTTSRELREIETIRFVEIQEHPWCQITDEDNRSHLANLKQTLEGYKLDWESLVAYGEMSWDRFRRERPPTNTQMRVHLAPTSHYAHRYSDPTQYVAYRVESDDSTEHLYGYVERASILHRKLLTHIPSGARRPMTLGLRFDPEAGADELVIIENLVYPRWTAPEVIRAKNDR